MMDDEFLARLFDRVYDSTLAKLEYKVETLGESIETIENELEHLYIYQGHSWAGRSEAKDQEIEASVQAYQIFIKRQKEKSDL